MCAALIESTHAVRYEPVTSRHCLRYGGAYLTPIDGPERITQEDIVGHPHVTRKEFVTMHFVVFVRASGDVVSFRCLPADDPAKAVREGTPTSLGGTASSSEMEIIRCAVEVQRDSRFHVCRGGGPSISQWVGLGDGCPRPPRRPPVPRSREQGRHSHLPHGWCDFVPSPSWLASERAPFMLCSIPASARIRLLCHSGADSVY